MSTLVNGTGNTRGAHLTGSLPLRNAEEVYLTCSRALGTRLSRMPDGETAERTMWINWQLAVLAAQPALEAVLPPPGRYLSLSKFRLRDDAGAAHLKFGELGYARAAETSYGTFAALKKEGLIPTECRFQVSLPTPLAPVTAFMVAECQATVEPAYERAMLAELARITDIVPAAELAVQWDVAVEFGVLEGVAFACHVTSRPEIVERLARLGEAVPHSTELGYHLCYGDLGRRHFVEPANTELLVDVANEVQAMLRRPVEWIQIPVPRNRTDPAYFAALSRLRRDPGTELFLGLVHDEDGLEGAMRRVRAARQFVTGFGIATECGMGRREPESIQPLLQLHEAVIEAMTEPPTIPAPGERSYM